MNKKIITFEAIAVILLLISSTTVVAHVNNKPIIDYFENSTETSDLEDYVLDKEMVEKVQNYMSNFFNEEGSDFKNFYESSEKVEALNNNLSILIEGIWDNWEEYLWYYGEGIWTKEIFFHMTANTIVNGFLEFFKEDEAFLDMLNDEEIASLQTIFWEGLNETLDETEYNNHVNNIGRSNIFNIFFDFLNRNKKRLKTENNYLEQIPLNEIQNTIGPSDNITVFCPIAIMICVLLCACTLILFGELGTFAMDITLLICILIVAGPVLFWNFVFGYIEVIIALNAYSLELWEQLLIDAEGHGLFGLVILALGLSAYVILAPVRWIVAVFFSILIIFGKIILLVVPGEIWENVEHAYEIAMIWFNRWKDDDSTYNYLEQN